MTISLTVIWFAASLAVLGLELFAATVYLLAVAAGLAAAGLASWTGAGLALQLSSCALVIIAGAAAARRFKKPARGDASEALMRADEGRTVAVESVDAAGRAVVRYRGAPWQARAASGVLEPGLWTIERVDGAELVLGAKVQR